MTNREKAICEVYTGICFCAGEQRKHVYEYAGELMGHPVLTHEFCDLAQTLRDRATEDFIALCKAEPTTAEQPEPMTREKILDAANRCVCTDRNHQYGGPERSFTAIAEMWTAYMHCKNHDITITAHDAAMMLALFKAARVTTSETPKADTYTDLAGYAACAGEIACGGEVQK